MEEIVQSSHRLQCIFTFTGKYFMHMHYYSTDRNNFGTGRKMHELCKQYTCICFISGVRLVPK